MAKIWVSPHSSCRLYSLSLFQAVLSLLSFPSAFPACRFVTYTCTEKQPQRPTPKKESGRPRDEAQPSLLLKACPYSSRVYLSPSFPCYTFSLARSPLSLLPTMAPPRTLSQRASDVVLYCNTSTALYMLEPWERALAVGTVIAVTSMAIYTASLFMPSWF